jgi:hypothetical protein
MFSAPKRNSIQSSWRWRQSQMSRTITPRGVAPSLSNEDAAVVVREPGAASEMPLRLQLAF